jgi:hypothetical protein
MRAKPRINWLLRQLREASNDLRIDVSYPNARQTAADLLSAVRDDAERLLYQPDPRREPRAFTLTMAKPMGQKRGKEEGSFVRETRSHAFDFYRDLVQNLKPWQARAPRLPAPGPEDDIDAATADPPPFVSSDEREVGAATEPNTIQ